MPFTMRNVLLTATALLCPPAQQQRLNALRLSTRTAFDEEEVSYGKMQAVELSKLRFTQSNIGAMFSQGQVDVFLPRLEENAFTILQNWYSEGIVVEDAPVKAKHTKNLRSSANKKYQAKKYEINPMLTITHVARRPISSDSGSDDEWKVELNERFPEPKFDVTIMAKSQAANNKGMKVTIPWPVKNKNGNLLVDPAVGAEFRLTHVNPRNRHVAFLDEPLLVSDAKQVLRSAARSGRSENDYLSAEQTLKSAAWRRAVGQYKVPKFDTMRVVHEPKADIYWSLDNRRLHCIKEVFEHDFLVKEVAPKKQRLIVKVFAIADLADAAKREASWELMGVAKQFFGKKNEIHGFAWIKENEVGPIAHKDDSHRHSALSRSNFVNELRSEGLSETAMQTVCERGEGAAFFRGVFSLSAEHAGRLIRVRYSDVNVSKRMAARTQDMKKAFPAPEIAKPEPIAYFVDGGADGMGCASLRSTPSSSRSGTPTLSSTDDCGDNSDSESDGSSKFASIRAALGMGLKTGNESSSDEFAESWEDLA